MNDFPTTRSEFASFIDERQKTSWAVSVNQLVLALAFASCIAVNAGGIVFATVKDVYVFSGTHFDLTFTGPPPHSFARNHRILDEALKLAGQQQDFRYVIENLYLFQQYLDTHPEKLSAYSEVIRKGRIGLAAQWSDIFQNLVTGEDLVRNILLAKVFARQYFDVTPLVQTLSDIPGQTSQAPQILSGSGIQGLIISRAGPRNLHLLNWRGLDGSTIPVVNLPFGYPGGYLMGISESLEAMEGTALAEFELSDISPDILSNKLKQPASLMNSLEFLIPKNLDRALVEVAWDNAMPPANLSANIAAWNGKHGDRLRLVPLLPNEFFSHFFPDDAPIVTGEIPSVWGNGYASLIGGYQQHIRTSHALLRAEKWASWAEILINKKYPSESLHKAWQEHLITLDHEGDSLRWQRDYSELLANRISEESQQAISSHIKIPEKMDVGLVVFNSMNWKRTQTIEARVYLVGDPFAFFTRPYHTLQLIDSDGNKVPFEIIEKESLIIRSIRIRFTARDIPPMGWKTFFLRPSDKPGETSFRKAEQFRGSSEVANDDYGVRFDTKSGSLRVTRKADNTEILVNYYHQPVIHTPDPGFFKEKDDGIPVRPQWQKLSKGVNLAGPFLELEGELLGARLRLFIQLDGVNPVLFSETLRWNGGKRIKLVRQIEFPNGGRFVYGIPFGTQELQNVMRGSGPPEEKSFDEIPRGYWVKNREFDGWAAWQANGKTVTVASEARGGTFDGRHLRINLLNASDPVLPDLVNHPIPGEYVTQFSLEITAETVTSNKRMWEILNPLEVLVSMGHQSTELPAEFAGVESNPKIMLTALKKAEDRRGWIARGYTGDQRSTWLGFHLPRHTIGIRVDLTEEDDSRAVVADAELRPFEIRSVRIEPLP